jgi:hypothetical protein
VQLTSQSNFFEIYMPVGFHILIFSLRTVLWNFIIRITFTRAPRIITIPNFNYFCGPYKKYKSYG